MTTPTRKGTEGQDSTETTDNAATGTVVAVEGQTTETSTEVSNLPAETTETTEQLVYVALSVALPISRARELGNRLRMIAGASVDLIDARTCDTAETIAAVEKVVRPVAPVGKVKKAVKDQPEGKTLEVLKLALREQGASPAELIALTGWTKSPWRWNFHNPQGTGWAQKYGYQFHVEKEGRGVRYYLYRDDATSDDTAVNNEADNKETLPTAA